MTIVLSLESARANKAGLAKGWMLATLLLGSVFLTATANGTRTFYASATDLPRFVRWVVASHDQGRTFGPPHAIDSNLYPQIQGQQAGDYVPAAANGLLAFTYTASAAPGATCPCGIFETSRDDGATWTRHPAPFPANWVAADPGHPGRFAIMSGQGVTAILEA